MTTKEKDKLATLVNEIIETTNVLHPESAQVLYNRIVDSDDSKVLDLLITHMNYIRIFEIYNRFDRQASSQDIGILLGIVEKMKKGSSQDGKE